MSTIKGFHVCKAGNAPTVGQTKTFIINGDRIKSAFADAGGQPYTVVSVTPKIKNGEPYTDKYGNLGFDIEVEAQNGSQSAPIGPQSVLPPSQGDNRSNRIERQHSQEMALRYFAMVGGFPEGTKPTDALRDMTSWFQRDVGQSPDKGSEEVF